MINSASQIDEGMFWIEVISGKQTRKYIVKLNTDQMRYEFVNSEGVPLSNIGGLYSINTVKRGKKSSRENVDLYDTGEFHESFKVKNINKKGFEIISDPVKDDGSNLLDRWGDELEGLTFESIDKLVLFLVPLYQQKLLRKLGV